MHHDPKEWREPSLYKPERFDSQSEWSLTPEGKKRNPLSFTPFLGGKRVCLGKTFAEVTVKFTVPLMYHYMDFEFVNADQKKERYSYGGQREIDLPMRVTVRNLVK